MQRAMRKLGLVLATRTTSYPHKSGVTINH